MSYHHKNQQHNDYGKPYVPTDKLIAYEFVRTGSMVKINHQTTNIITITNIPVNYNNDNESILLLKESSNDVIHVIDTSIKTVKNHQDSNTDIQFSNNSIIDSTIDDEDRAYTLHNDKVKRTKYESETPINKTIDKIILI